MEGVCKHARSDAYLSMSNGRKARKFIDLARAARVTCNDVKSNRKHDSPVDFASKPNG